MIIPKEEYVIGNRFVELGDYQITTNDFQIDPSKLTGDQIVFCKTDKIFDFFDIIRQMPNKRFIVISHNSDHNIDETRYSAKPDNVKHWFAQNVTIKRHDLTPIPIGLENVGVGGSSDYNLIEKMAQLEIPKDIYCYCNIAQTNPKERGFNRELPWITNEYNRVPFADYLLKVKRSQFVLSPPGNGLDCHRTWESIYLGSIPVVKASPAMVYFATYTPMVIVPCFHELSQEDLIPNATALFDIVVKMSWWKQKILETKMKHFI